MGVGHGANPCCLELALGLPGISGWWRGNKDVLGGEIVGGGGGEGGSASGTAGAVSPLDGGCPKTWPPRVGAGAT
jgi:hypothetical protein